MATQTRTVEYQDGDDFFEAQMAWDDAWHGARPGVLVAHAWQGRSDFENNKAAKLTELGYVGFALDLYGKGVLGSNPAENSALMQPYLDDRQMLQRRMQLGLSHLREQPEVDAPRVAALGFCFGGLCVLDLARSGADLKGVASFHGLLGSPGNTVGNTIAAKVLVLHGWDDPMAPPDQVLALAEELTSMHADWQIHGYGGTSHAFTNPQANDPANGLQYNASAERRSWQSLTAFLEEILA